jgi:hypothetical protein
VAFALCEPLGDEDCFFAHARSLSSAGLDALRGLNARLYGPAEALHDYLDTACQVSATRSKRPPSPASRCCSPPPRLSHEISPLTNFCPACLSAVPSSWLSATLVRTSMGLAVSRRVQATESTMH